MMSRHTIACLVLAAAVVGGVAGCNKGKSTGTSGKAPGGTPAVIPAAYFVEKEPEAAKGIVEVKKGAKPGDEVVMRGRIAGHAQPFTSGRAEFMMTDMSLPTCKDDCPTPWDHCCDDPKDIAASAATVEIVDETGNVIKGNAKGVHGLEPNTELVVVGKVKSLDAEGNLVVDATRVFVVKKG